MYKPIESDMKYKNLYIKYKNKYLDIKNKLSAIEESEHMGGFKKQVGGMPPAEEPRPPIPPRTPRTPRPPRPPRSMSPRYNFIKDKMTTKQADKYVADITYVNRKEKKKENICGLCLEKLSVGLPAVTNCKHAFHAGCLKEVEKYFTRCPMCRSDLGNNDTRSVNTRDVNARGVDARGVNVILPPDSLTIMNRDSRMIAFTWQDDGNEMIIFGTIENIRVFNRLTNDYFESETWNQIQNGFPFQADIEEQPYLYSVIINGINLNNSFYGEVLERSLIIEEY